jgi:hypothetical protein
MKLTDMKRSSRGDRVVYRSPATDRKGNAHYEVSVEGPKGAVEKALREADLLFDIEPGATQESADRRVMEVLKPWHREMAQRAMDPDGLKPKVKSKAPSERVSSTITISLRPTKERGTFFFFDTVFPVFLPVAPLFQVVLPPCSFGGIASFPVAGNPNVRIRFNSPLPPNAAASGFGGLAIDAASFVRAPWALVFPFNQFPVAVPSVARLMCWGGNFLPF